jgi:hypothetical protein
VEGNPKDQEVRPKEKGSLSREETHGEDMVGNGVALTLEYRDSNIFEGLVTAFRPRNLANISQRRIACMV